MHERAGGARPAEVIPSERSGHVALLKKELDLEAKTVNIRTAKLKVGQKSRLRVLRLPDKLLDLLRAQVARCQSEHLFAANGSLAHLFDRILERAGIAKTDELGRKLTAHSFRHTFATLQASAVSFNPSCSRKSSGISNSRPRTAIAMRGPWWR